MLTMYTVHVFIIIVCTCILPLLSVTSAKIRKLMMSKHKTTPTEESHDDHMTKKEEEEEDEGEILSDEEMETDHKSQGPSAVR